MTPLARVMRALAGPQSLLTLGVLCVALAIFVPVSPGVLDVLLTLSLTMSIFVIVMVLRLGSPMEFSTFPSLLLLLTFFRLAMNVASTRLILTTGEGGRVITGFGEYVVGGSLVIGLVVFLILNIINFVVITKGAGRIAEVGARFALDALPGKQMAIDQELANNLIDEKEASRRRDLLARETDFAGTMDGAMKFVRGDAIAGIIITLINLLGGFAIGMFMQGLSASEAIRRYVILSIGDGLVSQIPAVLVSLAAALLVTYSTRGGGFAGSLARELGASPATLQGAGAAVAILGLAPGLPLVPFAVLGGGLALAGRALAQRQATPPPPPPAPAAPAAGTGAVAPGLFDLDLGMGLLDILRGGLVERLKAVRETISDDLGFPLPPVHVRDNFGLEANAYRFAVREEAMPLGYVQPKHVLIFRNDGTKPALGAIPHTPTVDAVLRRPAAWVPEAHRTALEVQGFEAHDVVTVIASHMADLLRKQAWRLLTREHVKLLVTRLQEQSPSLVEDLLPNKVSYVTLHRVLQALLREGVSIRHLELILEALSDAPPELRDVEALTEMARRALGGVIAQRYIQRDGVLRPIVLEPAVEMGLRRLTQGGLGERTGVLTADQVQQVVHQAAQFAQKFRRGAEPAPFLVAPDLRSMVRRLLEQGVPHVPVLALSEIPTGVGIEPVAKVELTHA